MAAPSVTYATAYFTATLQSSHTVSVPAGTAYKGVWIVTYSSVTTTISAPAGWTVKFTIANSGNRKLCLVTSDAATSDTSVAIGTGVTTNAAAQGFSTDGNLSAVVTPAGVIGSGTAPDPPASGALTSGDYRIMAAAGYWDSRRTVTYPTSYSDNQVNVRGTANNEAALGLATRGMTGITAEDPGAFTISGSVAWSAGMAAIPAVSAGGPFTGAIASTLGAVTSDIDGTVDNGDFFTGDIDTTLAAVTANVDGLFFGPPYPGDIPSAAVIAIYDARTLGGAVNDPVASWADFGPLNQAALAQGTSANRPVIDDSGFGGIRSVKFDGVNDNLTHTALASTYTGDFAFILVYELLTYPTATAGVLMSCDAIPNKHIFGWDDVEDPPGWVVMSSNDGTQAQHHHGTADQAYVEAVPSRFVSVQLVRNAGQHKLWENTDLVIDLADSSGEDSDLNNLTKLKLGSREDNSRHGNYRCAYFMVVDMAFTDEATLLDARDELGADFNVPAFAETAWTGTIAVTLGAVGANLDGTVTAPVRTGVIASTLGAVGADLNGTRTVPTYSGTIAETLDPVLADLTGTRTIPAGAGVLDGIFDPVLGDLNGTFKPTYHGTIAKTLSPVLGDLNGLFDGPGNDGEISPVFGPVLANLDGTRTAPVGAGFLYALLDPVDATLAGGFAATIVGSGGVDSQVFVPRGVYYERPRGLGYGAMVGDLLVRLAIHPEFPLRYYTRDSLAPRVDQAANVYENVPDIGYQFIRTDLTGGAGLDYYPRRQSRVQGVVANDETRFWDSRNIDISRTLYASDYYLRLHRKIVLWDEYSPETALALGRITNSFFVGTDTKIHQYITLSSTTPFQTTTVPAAVEEIRNLGNDAYALLADGNIWRKLAGASLFTLWADAGASNYTGLWTVKGRVLAERVGASANELVEIDFAGTGVTVIDNFPLTTSVQGVVDAGPVILAAVTDGYIYSYQPDDDDILGVVSETELPKGESPISIAYNQGLVVYFTGDSIEPSNETVFRIYLAEVLDSRFNFVVGNAQLIQESISNVTLDTGGFSDILITRDEMWASLYETDVHGVAEQVSLFRLDVATRSLNRAHSFDVTGVKDPKDLSTFSGRKLFVMDGSVFVESDSEYAGERFGDDIAWLITPNINFGLDTPINWMTSTFDVTNLVASGIQAEMYRAEVPNAIFDQPSENWLLTQRVTHEGETTQVEHTKIQARQLSIQLRLYPHAGLADTPHVRRFGFRGIPSHRDWIVEIPVNISDYIEVPHRMPVHIPNWGDRVHEACQMLVGSSVEVLIYDPPMSFRGVVDGIDEPITYHADRGSIGRVATLRCRGEKITATESSTGDAGVGLGMVGVATVGIGQTGSD